MAKLARKNYKGIEFPQNFKMEQGRFNEIFSNCHIFKKLIPEEKKKHELETAWSIASERRGAAEPVSASIAIKAKK